MACPATRGLNKMTYEQRLAQAQHQDDLDKKARFDDAYRQAEIELGINTIYTINNTEWWKIHNQVRIRAEEILRGN